MFEKGDRVITPNGPGTVVYKRMAAPDYTTAYVYSVCLDAKKNNPKYTGTIVKADDVKKG